MPGPLATWGQRVSARFIDSFCVAVPYYILLFIVRAIGGGLAGVGIVAILGIAGWCYITFLNGAQGQSPGKALTGLVVVSEESGQFIGGGMGIVREIAHFVDTIICYIGWLFPLWDSKKQTIADKIVHTVVYTGGPRSSFVQAFKLRKNS